MSMPRRIITKKNKLFDFAVHRVLLLLIIALGAVLLLKNLGNHCLWQDEAETALVGKTILTHGIPIGTDGKNSFSQDMAGDERKYDPWRLHPWLQFYVVALSFALFGADTFSARLPFALIGIGVIFLTYIFTRDLFKNRWIALIAAGLIATSVPFLLLSRQSRYYSLLIFLALLTTWIYTRFMQRGKFTLPVFIISASLCFHTFYPGFMVLILALSAHALLFHRSELKLLGRALVWIGFINFPWFLWFRAYPGVRRQLYSPMHIIQQLSDFVKIISVHVFSPWLFLMALLVALMLFFSPKWKRKIFKHNSLTSPQSAAADKECARYRIQLPSWKAPFFLLIIIISAYPVFFSIPAHTFFRYLGPIIPFLCILTALIVYGAFQAHPFLGICALALVIWMQPLNDFVYEITHDYLGPIKGISSYLNKNGKMEDTVLITYDDLPLKFYTGMRIMGGYTGEDLKSARKAEWIIIRKYVNSPYEWPIRRYIKENISFSNYKKIVLNCPDLPYENRECPCHHHFRTVLNEDRVIIYKRISQLNPFALQCRTPSASPPGLAASFWKPVISATKPDNDK